MAQFLEKNFPDLRGNIVGELYPVPPMVEFATNVISLLQLMALSWMVIGGEKVVRMTGYRGPLPSLYWRIQENAMPIAIVLFLIVPQVVNSFRNSGAFEIYFGETEIYSKLATGSMPNKNQIAEPLKALGLRYIGA